MTTLTYHVTMTTKTGVYTFSKSVLQVLSHNPSTTPTSAMNGKGFFYTS